MHLNNLIEEIKQIRIQGANNIALAGIEAFIQEPTKENFNKIISTRPTEPLLQNSLKSILNSKNKKNRGKQLITYIKKSSEKISREGNFLIKDGMNIFTHCHSSSVIGILKEAKKRGKNFVVYNTETTPLLQGRKTAEELAESGIKVIHLPDSAAEFGLKQCDLFLFGADAFIEKGVVNKIGTSMLCELARLHNIPAYSCGISLKFTKKIKIEMRSAKEVWDERKKMIEVKNPAFDLTNKKFISGVVSEMGLFTYAEFIKKSQANLENWSKE